VNSTETSPALPTKASPLLSERLAQLHEMFADQRATLRAVLVALEGKAYLVLIVLLALPFSAPVSVPGSSTPLGLAIVVIAVQLAFGRLPWLPRRMLEWRLPEGFFTKLVPGTQKVVRGLERILHPRLATLTSTSVSRGVHYITICVAALLLALPMPIPFTNTLPGWAILLLACGLLERDGFFIVAGYAMLVATAVFFVFLGSAITDALYHSWLWLMK
jgi:hypothetical protein